MDQEPEFYVSPEDLEAQLTADERGEGCDASMHRCCNKHTKVPREEFILNLVIMSLFVCVYPQMAASPS